AFRMMVEVGSMEALDILSTASTVIAEGEVLQLSAAKNMATTEDEYLAVIRAKTAALFSAAAEVGPVVANGTSDDQAAFRSYGTNLGLAFQMIDDALDYGGNSKLLGKDIGDDFREGKITLPVVLAYRRGTDEEREFWRRSMEEGDIQEGDLERAIELMNSYGTISDTLDRAHHYGAIARDALAPFPDTAHKTALLEAVDFCISRAY
ncbi:MAG: polyprenyl synthetase family protein, partial [Hyphomicrobiales bacterium]